MNSVSQAEALKMLGEGSERMRELCSKVPPDPTEAKCHLQRIIQTAYDIAKAAKRLVVTYEWSSIDSSEVGVPVRRRPCRLNDGRVGRGSEGGWLFDEGFTVELWFPEFSKSSRAPRIFILNWWEVFNEFGTFLNSKFLKELFSSLIVEKMWRSFVSCALFFVSKQDLHDRINNKNNYESILLSSACSCAGVCRSASSNWCCF